MSRFNKHKLRIWSIKVRRRDGVCQICGSRERRQAHHINSKSYFPEQAYDLDNGVTLCADDKKTGNKCHLIFHNLFMGGTRRKCTRADFDKFARLARWVRGWGKNKPVELVI